MVPYGGACEARSPTLNELAEASRVAHRAAGRAYRAFKKAPPGERERLKEVWLAAKHHRKDAVARHDQRWRDRNSLLCALSAAQWTIRCAEEELTWLEDEFRRRRIRAVASALLALEALERLTADLVAIEGKGALPREQV
jgi:hypothetical protein